MRRDSVRRRPRGLPRHARTFVDKEILPHVEAWSAAGAIPRELFAAAGRQGLLGMDVPEEYGGGGVPDFRFNTVLVEELLRTPDSGAGLGISLHNDICLPYFLALLHRRAEASGGCPASPPAS